MLLLAKATLAMLIFGGIVDCGGISESISSGEGEIAMPPAGEISNIGDASPALNKTKKINELIDKIAKVREDRKLGSDEDEWVEELVSLVDEAESLGSIDAVAIRGELHLLGEGLPQNLTLAFQYLKKAADKGNPHAQMNLGFMYGKGFHKNGLSDRDDAQSLLNYYFAALGGAEEAQMVLGYRHLYGYGVPKSCNAAIKFYSSVAQKVVAYHSEKAISKPVELVRLSDEKARANKLEETEDVIQYYQHSAENGNADAQLGLGQLHFYGARGVTQNTEAAAGYFRQAAEQGNAAAQANLAQMYIQGIGVKQDNDTAFKYFEKAAEKGESAALNGLGFMYLHGYGIKKDTQKAIKYFKMSAEKGNVDAQFNLGAMYFAGMGIDADYGAALQYFTLAGHQGHVRSLFNLAQMHMNGLGTVQSCPIAVKLFKSVSERGKWAQSLSSAHKDYLREDHVSSFAKYCRAADQGYELAQSNAAWLLDKEIGYPFEDRHSASLDHLEHAATQGNVDAHRAIGDYYYYGLGAKNNTPNYKLAARHYTLAGEQKNAHANFNLGFMHQLGVGLPFDLHLAKRFYDLALESSAEAWVPVQMALAGLVIHQFYLDALDWWDSLTSQKKNSMVKKASGSKAEADDSSDSSKSQKKSKSDPKQSIMDLFGDIEDVILLIACGFLAILIYIRSNQINGLNR